MCANAWYIYRKYWIFSKLAQYFPTLVTILVLSWGRQSRQKEIWFSEEQKEARRWSLHILRHKGPVWTVLEECMIGGNCQERKKSSNFDSLMRDETYEKWRSWRRKEGDGAEQSVLICWIHWTKPSLNWTRVSHHTPHVFLLVIFWFSYPQSTPLHNQCRQPWNQRIHTSHVFWFWWFWEYSLPHPSGPNKTVLLLHKLLLKALPVTTLYPY